MRAPRDVSAERVLLERLGARDRRHSGGSLLDHLLGVRQILERWGAPDHVLGAGLLHSVYGTQPYERPLLSLDHRARVRRAAGDDAEQLVYDYAATPVGALVLLGLGRTRGIVDRFTGARRTFTEPHADELLCVRLADLLEQGPRLEAASGASMSEPARRFWTAVAERLGGPSLEDWRAYDESNERAAVPTRGGGAAALVDGGELQGVVGGLGKHGG